MYVWERIEDFGWTESNVEVPSQIDESVIAPWNSLLSADEYSISGHATIGQKFNSMRSFARNSCGLDYK